MGRWTKTAEERFWEKVDKTEDEECWNWIANKDLRGYGKIRLNRSGVHYNEFAHRFSFVIHSKNPIPCGLWVLHRCDNPSCVNPSHLFLGTPKDNTQDMFKKGRNGYTGLRGTVHHKAKFSETDIADIRLRLAKKESCRSIAISYGVSRPCIQDIKSGDTWKHVP